MVIDIPACKFTYVIASVYDCSGVRSVVKSVSLCKPEILYVFMRHLSPMVALTETNIFDAFAITTKCIVIEFTQDQHISQLIILNVTREPLLISSDTR